MANAVYVNKVTATTGNAVFVESIKATSVPPVVVLNAVIVYDFKATSVPGVSNAVLAYGVGATSTPPTQNAVYVHKLAGAITGSAPTASAGADQTNIEPWALVILDGGASTDPGGSVVSYAWTQTNGPAVTLTGSAATRTFKAPATMDGTQLTFSLVVTDNSGLKSAADVTKVTVLPATEFKRVAGAWVPVLIRSRKAGAWV